MTTEIPSAPSAPAAPAQSANHTVFWRATTVVCLLLMAIGIAMGMSMFQQFKAQIVHLQTQLQATPHIKYIAVLQDSKQAPALLITFDPQDAGLEIQRLSAVKEGREDSMQLWAIGADGTPRSVGVLSPGGKTLQLAATEAALAGVGQLAISVENRGGAAPSGGPRLPYLFTGALVQKAL